MLILLLVVLPNLIHSKYLNYSEFDLPPNIPRPFDSLEYGSLLEYNLPCSEYPLNENCKFVGTPQLNGIIQWNCTKGNYCVGPGNMFQCSKGFYCPENAAQPVFCPKGFYCESADTIKICPEGYYCPLGNSFPYNILLFKGAVQPVSCYYLASCPEGSATAQKFGIIGIIALFCIFPIFIFKFKYYLQRIRYQAHKNQAEKTIADPLVKIGDDALPKIEKTFDICFNNLGLVLPCGTPILRNITGQIKSHRTTAIMGPSGSGKTTFISLLAGKIKRTHGTVEINGNSDELSNYKKLIGYVPQEDIMIRELTVREILMHSARMRLPSDLSLKQIKTKVLEIIKFLRISHVMDSIIGNEEMRGISGGQRKRVNIGMELVAEPSILFLDEPTSGLDSSTAFEICTKLHRLAHEEGLTVAAVIHSPTPASFKQFDDLLLLGNGGRVAYMGPRDKVASYFMNMGYRCDADNSVSDYIMDVVSGKICRDINLEDISSSIFEFWEASLKQNETAIISITENSIIKCEPHSKSSLSIKLSKFLIDHVSVFREWLYELFLEFIAFFKCLHADICSKKDPIRNTCGLQTQLWLLMKRSSKQVYSTSKSFLFDVLLHFGCGFFIGTAIQNNKYIGSFPKEICISQAMNLSYNCWWPVDQMREAGMFICIGIFFSGISAATTTFGREKTVFWRDSGSGMSSVPYFMAKFCVDIPRIILAGLMYSSAVCIFYPLRGSFISLLLIVELLYFVAFGIGYFISILFSSSQTPLLGVGVALLNALVLSGVVPGLKEINSDSFTKIFSFLWDLSASRWMIEAFWIQEVSSSSFSDNAFDAPHGYFWNNYPIDVRNILLLAISWNLMSLLSLRMINRAKLK